MSIGKSLWAMTLKVPRWDSLNMISFFLFLLPALMSLTLSILQPPCGYVNE